MAFAEGNQAWRKREDRKILTDALRREVIQFECETRKIKAGEAARTIARKVVELALDNDKWALQFLFERTEGKPDSKVDITHHDGESLNEKQAKQMAEEFLTRAARTESVG